MYKRSKYDRTVLLLLASWVGLTLTWGSPLVQAVMEERRQAEWAKFYEEDRVRTCALLTERPTLIHSDYANMEIGWSPYYGPFYYEECLGGGH